MLEMSSNAKFIIQNSARTSSDSREAKGDNSQDTWILHSAFKIHHSELKLLLLDLADTQVADDSLLCITMQEIGDTIMLSPF